MSEANIQKPPTAVIPKSPQYIEGAELLKEHQIQLNPGIIQDDAVLTLVEAAYKYASPVRDDDGGLDTYESDLPHFKAQELIDGSKNQDEGTLARIAHAFNRAVNVVIKDEGNGVIGLYDIQTGEPLEGKRSTKILQNASDRFKLLLGDREDEAAQSHEPAKQQLEQIIELAKRRFQNIKPELRPNDYSPPLEAYPSLGEALDWLLTVEEWVSIDNPKYPDKFRGKLSNGDTATIAPHIYPDMQSMIADRDISSDNSDSTPLGTVRRIWISFEDSSPSYLLVETKGGHEMIFKAEPSEDASQLLASGK